MNQTEKKKLAIFVAIAYGVTYLMGIFMYIGFKKDVDLTTLATVQMMYPAVGVMLGKLIYKEEDKPVTKAAYILSIILTVILMVLGLLAVFAPIPDMDVAGQTIGVYYLIAQYVLIPLGLAIFVVILASKKEKKENSGFVVRNVKKSIGVIILFLCLYVLRTFLAYGLSIATGETTTQEFVEWMQMLVTPQSLMMIAVLPINFIFSFAMFMGEEYGWRYYLQPVLQKKFGLKGGVLLLGLVWGLWHLPIDFMYYTRETGAQMLVNQIITCTAYAIFFGYAYMKTQNIWVPIIIHYLNNNLVPIFAGNYSSDVLENQSVAWKDIPLAFVLMIVYFLFIFAKEYREKKEV